MIKNGDCTSIHLTFKDKFNQTITINKIIAKFTEIHLQNNKNLDFHQ